MVWTVTAVTFLSTVFVLLAVLYGLSSSEVSIGDRLTRMWRPPAPATQAPFRQRQKERVEVALAHLGKLLPPPTQKMSHSQRLLVRGGYRSSTALLALRGAKLLMPAAVLGILYLTHVYRMNPYMVPFAGFAAFMLPDLWASWKAARRQHRLRLALPDALDLLVICVEAGLGLDQSILRVSQELRISHRELSEEFQLVNLEMRVGKSRTEALRELADRTGVDDIKSLVAMLVQTDRFGTSIAQSLRVHSDDLRVRRRQRAEEMAAKTTVKMVPPLVFCIFPALIVVILGPAVISLVRQLLPSLK